jgi:hypothetical protein
MRKGRIRTTSRDAMKGEVFRPSIQIEFTGMNRGRLAGNTSFSNQCSPPPSQNKGAATTTKAMPIKTKFIERCEAFKTAPRSYQSCFSILSHVQNEPL